MIIALFLLLVVLIAFHEMGLAALIVLPLTVVMVVGLLSFFGILIGIEGSGEIFLWCAGIIGGIFGLIFLIDKAGNR